MPIVKTASVVTKSAPNNLKQALETGVWERGDFAVCGNVDSLKQIAFNPSNLSTDTTTTLTPAAGSSGVMLMQQAAPQYAAPLTGVNTTIAAGTGMLILKPAGTLDAATVTLPATPENGFVVTVCCTQIVTALTVSGAGGDTVNNAPEAFTAGGFFSLVYRTADTSWYRCG